MLRISCTGSRPVSHATSTSRVSFSCASLCFPILTGTWRLCTMVSMPPELGDTSHDKLSELSSLVKKIETAQLESRPLSSDEATALDVAFSKTNLRELCQAKLADSAKSELCSLAHRIWAAVGQGPPYDPLQDAKCRNLACNIFSASFRGCIPPNDALLLSAHWAFSGQAWMRADASSPLALPCFAEAAKAWRSQPSVKLAQVAAQALLWAGEAHFRQVSYIEAFSQLSQARDIICSYQDWDGMPGAQKNWDWNAWGWFFLPWNKEK